MTLNLVQSHSWRMENKMKALILCLLFVSITGCASYHEKNDDRLDTTQNTRFR